MITYFAQQPPKPLEFNLGHCASNAGGFSTLSAHNLLFASLQKVNTDYYEGKLRWQLTITVPPPGRNSNPNSLNKCNTQSEHKDHLGMCMGCYKQARTNSNVCQDPKCKKPINATTESLPLAVPGTSQGTLPPAPQGTGTRQAVHRGKVPPWQPPV